MSHTTSNKRAEAASLIRQALDLGVRKELRAALQRALEIAEGDAPKELTQLHYERMVPGSRLADPNRKGLIMKCSKAGTKRWTYRTTDGSKKQVEITLGHYPAMSVAEAREAWSEVRAQRMAGVVPNSEEDERAKATLGDIAEEYIAWVVENRRTGYECERLMRRHVLPGREDIRLADLDIDHLNSAIGALQVKSPQEARKVRSVISVMLKRAKKANRLAKGFTITPAMLVEVERSGVREYSPTSGDLRAFLRATREMGEAGAMARFIALTGVRRREAADMTWAEVEGDRWTIPAARMKGKREHVVFLSPAALEILDARRDNGSEKVFSMSADRLIRVWAQRRDAEGLPAEFTLHRLRGALSTWIAESGGTRDIRDRLTAHTLATGIDAHYNAASLHGPAREWWMRWANHLAAVEAENVVQIRPKKA